MNNLNIKEEPVDWLEPSIDEEAAQDDILQSSAYFLNTHFKIEPASEQIPLVASVSNKDLRPILKIKKKLQLNKKLFKIDVKPSIRVLEQLCSLKKKNEIVENTNLSVIAEDSKSSIQICRSMKVYSRHKTVGNNSYKHSEVKQISESSETEFNQLTPKLPYDFLNQNIKKEVKVPIILNNTNENKLLKIPQIFLQNPNILKEPSPQNDLVFVKQVFDKKLKSETFKTDVIEAKVMKEKSEVKDNIKTYKSHKLCTTKSKLYLCSECNQSFPSIVRLEEHKEKHISAVLYNCHICRFSTINKNSLKRHSYSHNKSKHLFSCPHCDFSTQILGQFKLHKSSHSRDKKYKCIYCAFTTKSFVKMEKHKKGHLKDVFQCSECEFSSQRLHYLNMHKIIHTEAKLYKCEHCDYSGVHLRYLRVHKKVNSH